MAGRAGASDERFMGLAVEAAREGLGRTAPNPAVGCVIVRRGRVVGRGFHRRAGGPHAEAVALEEAGGRARGATAYVTLEPCRHWGKTPPCTRALLEAGIERVVVGAVDPDPRSRGAGLRELRRGGLKVSRDVLGERCDELIEGFTHWVRHGRPLVRLKLAATLDGRTATRSGQSKWISGSQARRRVQEMRRRADAILVGVGTVLKDDPRLTCRVRGAADPLRIVLDSRLRTPPAARVVAGPGKLLVVCSSDAPAARRRRLERKGAEVLSLAAAGRRPRLDRVLTELGRRGLHELLVEGGSGVATSFVSANMVNFLTIFYNPRLIGGDGSPLVGPLGVDAVAKAIRATTACLERCGDDFVWTGRIR